MVPEGWRVENAYDSRLLCDPDPKEEVGRSMKRLTSGANALLAVTICILIGACGGTAPLEEPADTPELAPDTSPAPGVAPAGGAPQ